MNVLTSIKKFIPTAKIFNIRKSCNSEGLSFLGINNLNKNIINKADYIFAINLDDTFSTFKMLVSSKKTLFWFNTHSTLFSSHCNLFLPLSSNLERDSIFLNLEQRPQESLKVFTSKGNSRSFFDLLVCLFDLKLPNYSGYLNEILKDNKLFDNNEKILLNISLSDLNSKNLISTYPFKSIVEDYYSTNKTTKKSLVMSQCSQEHRKSAINF